MVKIDPATNFSGPSDRGSRSSNRKWKTISNQSALGPSAVSTQPLPSGVFKGLLWPAVADQRRWTPRGPPIVGPRVPALGPIQLVSQIHSWVISFGSMVGSGWNLKTSVKPTIYLLSGQTEKQSCFSIIHKQEYRFKLALNLSYSCFLIC
jgi:hypothetical protein